MFLYEICYIYMVEHLFAISGFGRFFSVSSGLSDGQPIVIGHFSMVEQLLTGPLHYGMLS